jgi:alkylation response protein AidB-like acyl-CoA dehydrogenase
VPTTISLEDFERDARAFLAAHLAPRQSGCTVPAEVRLPLVGSLGEDIGPGMRAARDWAASCADAGFGWIAGPTRLGGSGLTDDHARRFRALLEEYDAPDPLLTRTGTTIIGPSIERFGSPEQIADLLPRIHRGELVLCQLFSEPNAGSDLASVTTRAEVDGDRILISGQKVWSSGALYADVGECLVRVVGVQGRAALAMVLVDLRLPGITIRPIVQMTGGSDFCEVFLDDVIVDRSAMLGEVGDGWKIALDTLANERQSIGADVIPVTDIERTLSARVAGVEAARRDIVMQAIVETRVSALLSTRLQTADVALMPLIKLSASQALLSVADALSNVGGMSIVAAAGALPADADVVCGVPGFRIGGGSDEILRSLVAERALGLPRDDHRFDNVKTSSA